VFGRALSHKAGGFGFDFQYGPWKFSISPWVHSASNRNQLQIISFWGKVRPASTADNSAVPVVPNVNIRIEDQHSIHPVGFHDLLGNQFFFTFFTQNTVGRNSVVSWQVRR